MARQYIVNSWVGACEYDEGDTYSGEQLGNRNQKSVEVKMHRSGDNWQANQPEVWVNGKPNIKAFTDTEAPKKTKKSIPIAHQITPQQRSLDKLDVQELALHKAYKNDEVSLEEYEELLYALDQKRERAFKSLCKALGRSTTCDSVYPVGQGGWEEKTSNNGLYGCNKPMLGIDSLPMMGCKKNDWKSDMKLFLTGSVIGLIILLTLVNI